MEIKTQYTYSITTYFFMLSIIKKYFLSIYYIPGIVVSPGNTPVNKTSSTILVFVELLF